MLVQVVLALAPLAPAQETRVETWPDGSKKAEYEVVADGQGGELRQGRFRSFHAGGELESEGQFQQGKETGAWVFHHPGGALAAQGSYADGLRTGPWETFHENGEPESKGSYKRGARSGRWTFWNADGSKDLAASGLYEFQVYRSRDGQRHYRGYLVDNQRQGTWTSFWPDGAKQFEGRFEGGEREGEWLFFHPDGTPSALILSGVYSGGQWQGPPAPRAAPASAAPLPAPEPHPLGWPEDRAELEAALDTLLQARLANEGSLAAFRRAGARALPLVLERLAATPPSAEGRSTIGFLEEHVLRTICQGHALGRSGAQGPPDEAGASELVRSWFSLWALMRTDPSFWELRLASTPPVSGPGGRDALQDPPLLDRDPVFEAPAAKETPEKSGPRDAGAAPGAYATRFGKARNELLRGALPGTEPALDAALRWLAMHQSSSGLWDGDGFTENCGKIGPGTCEGPGTVGHDVGLTGLALLALMGDGNAPTRGEYQAQVVRGLEWLVKHQQSSGLVGEMDDHAFLYDHAIGAAALCEGLGLGAESLREPAEKAIAYVHRARNVGMAWRYAVPPVGDNDTSITGWMVSALSAAERAGLAVDPLALEGAVAWLDHATDPGTGRVGYDEPGSFSSRTPENESFPREKGEAMTASALFSRILLRQRPDATPVMRRHAEVLLKCLPVWDPEYGCDLYYWYYGTQALHQMGKPYWPAWEALLKDALLETQRENGDRKGSWDPVGPWGYACGRVGSTALAALTLEYRHRFPRLIGE